MNDAIYSVGEVAKLTGLTIRTLQHYDNIGLVPASGRTEGGRRYYTENDLLQLEQVIFYKLLDFSLEEISNKLIKLPDEKSYRDMLLQQEFHLLRRMEQLHTAFATLDAMLLVMDAGKTPSAHDLLKSLSFLPDNDIWENAPDSLTHEQKEFFEPYFPDFEAAQGFYRRWKELEIKAGALLHAGVKADNPIAQELGVEWERVVAIFADDAGNMGTPSTQPEMSPLFGDKEEFHAVNTYLDEVLAIYFQKNKKEEFGDD